MCFAPYISLSTFVIEFLLALYFLFKNPKDKLIQIIALISFLLGLYQLNEFLICITSLKLFTIFAMSITALLPAIGISYALIMWRKKIAYYWHILIYSPAIFFIICFNILYKESAKCLTIFVQYPKLGLINRFYSLYYILFIVGAVILFYLGTASVRSKFEKRLFYMGMFGMFIFTVPTYIFLTFLPMFNKQFASVLCEFGLLLAIEFIVLLWYKEKHKIKY